MLSDDEFMTVLEECTAMEKLQEEMKKKMSDGIFGMAIARKGGCTVTPDHCREDFDACSKVRCDEGVGVFELCETKPELDPLLLISGLPPPSLKKSQKHFKAALGYAVELANIVNRIQRLRATTVAGVGYSLSHDMVGLSVSEGSPEKK